MIDFHRLTLNQKEDYEAILLSGATRGCEYSFANLYLWGRQLVAFRHDCVVFFSHFDGRSVYPYPIGPGDRRRCLEEILEDARQRGIPCRIVSMTAEDVRELEEWFPERFHFRTDRDSFDYVYAIDDLADLKGKKFQKKRNHYNRFCAAFPDHEMIPLDSCSLDRARHLVDGWFYSHIRTNPERNYLLENIAMSRAFQNYGYLDMEGCILMVQGQAAAVTMATRLSEDTFDVHFEKAREDIDGAYGAVNCEFARYLRGKYPRVRFLNREDDMGIEGLRKAKLSYQPHHMVEKYWAYVKEDLNDL